LAGDAETDARRGVIEKFNSEGLQGKLHIVDSYCAEAIAFLWLGVGRIGAPIRPLAARGSLVAITALCPT